MAQGAFADPTVVGTYAPFSVTMNYVSADLPDTAVIQIQIVGPGTGMDVHVGSVMHVDGLTFRTGSAPAPVLSIQQTNNGVAIDWPANVTGYTLQRSPTLQPPSWSNVPGVVNNSHLVPPNPTDPVAFFRLFKE